MSHDEDGFVEYAVKKRAVLYYMHDKYGSDYPCRVIGKNRIPRPSNGQKQYYIEYPIGSGMLYGSLSFASKFINHFVVQNEKRKKIYKTPGRFYYRTSITEFDVAFSTSIPEISAKAHVTDLERVFLCAKSTDYRFISYEMPRKEDVANMKQHLKVNEKKLKLKKKKSTTKSPTKESTSKEGTSNTLLTDDIQTNSSDVLREDASKTNSKEEAASSPKSFIFKKLQPSEFSILYYSPSEHGLSYPCRIIGSTTDPSTRKFVPVTEFPVGSGFLYSSIAQCSTWMHYFINEMNNFFKPLPALQLRLYIRSDEKTYHTYNLFNQNPYVGLLDERLVKRSLENVKLMKGQTPTQRDLDKMIEVFEFEDVNEISEDQVALDESLEFEELPHDQRRLLYYKPYQYSTSYSCRSIGLFRNGQPVLEFPIGSGCIYKNMQQCINFVHDVVDVLLKKSNRPDHTLYIKTDDNQYKMYSKNIEPFFDISEEKLLVVDSLEFSFMDGEKPLNGNADLLARIFQCRSGKRGREEEKTNDQEPERKMIKIDEANEPMEIPEELDYDPPVFVDCRKY
ncbi:SVF1-like protein [Acrasis kona]|uniref:SVF1-like protein n=1 Tax=Acrasis kona TaxID=1008807 RepID=A0AAW2ZI74_9EUKA